MHALFQLFWSIATFKKGPDAVPYSWPLLALVALMNFLMAWHQFSYRVPIHSAALFAGILILILAGFSCLVLAVKGHASRCQQTITALLGVNFLINMLLYPLILLGPLLQWLPVLVYFILMAVLALNVWLLMITGHIYARALVLPFIAGLLVAVALLGIDIIIFAKLLPPPKGL